MATLTNEQVSAALAEIPGWERSGSEIVRSIRFPEFIDGVRFVDRLAEMAEAADHHPDIDIRYRMVRLALTTHDEGGITDKDFALARQINNALDGEPDTGGRV
jgi:4a-hydroxytetrahydrobiopterin dehydratase